LLIFYLKEKGFQNSNQKRKRPSYLHFIDSEGPGPLRTYPWGIRTS